MSKIFIAGVDSGHNLPSAYQEVEYLQSSGTQYIDTGVTLNNSTMSIIEFNCVYQYNATPSGTEVISGCKDSSTEFNLLGSNLYHPSYCQAGSAFTTVSVGRDISKHTVQTIINKTAGTQSITVDTTTATASGVTYPTNINLYLFAFNSNRTATYFSNTKLYSCSYSLEGTLIRNLIPCYRKSDSVAGMYDIVNDVFYTNSGTGSFVVGPDVSSLSEIETVAKIFVAGSADVGSLGEIEVYEKIFVYDSGPTELCFTANTAGSTIELCVVGSPSIANTAYSYDRETWTTFTPSTTVGTNTITLTNVGDKVYFRNDITANLSGSNYMQFKMSGSIAASGNINSMYDADGFNSLTTLTYTYCYYYMFRECTSLTAAPALPATTLASSCYQGMFYGCTSLTAAPALPATTLASSCYNGMFLGCTSLTTAPNLPATTLASSCYNGMFLGCTSLTAAPTLPVTTLASSCYYNMFSGCTSLTAAPALPATTLASDCYNNMFSNCTSLTAAPTLPATTLAFGCYNSMFASCTSLTAAPTLPATTLTSGCYQGMFSNCTSLTTAPTLPATTLAFGCYYYMFSGCTSLTAAPALPATTLADYCYNSMFRGCTSLYVSDAAVSGTAEEAWIMPTTGTFTNTSTQSSMFTNCLGTRSSNNLVATAGSSVTYYTQNTPVQ